MANLQFNWIVWAQILHFQKLQRGISEYKGVLHCEGYDYEELPDEFIEAPLSEPFFTRRMKIPSGTEFHVVWQTGC